MTEQKEVGIWQNTYFDPVGPNRETSNRLIRLTRKPSASPLKQLKSEKLPPDTNNRWHYIW